jgi:hypothetical protein
MIGAIARIGVSQGLTVETTLDPTIQPFLYDHQIEGTPVLPGVMGIEAFAETAMWMLPGWQVAAVEDVNFLVPFKFYRNEPRTLTIQAAFHPEGEAVVADCKLVGSRTLPNQAEPHVSTHFTARVRLTKRPQEAQRSRAPGEPANSIIDATDIYRLFFHGPAYQVLEQAWWDGDRIVGKMAGRLPANHVPPETSTVIEPRLIELCFQTVGLWEISALHRLGLPRQIQQVSLLRAAETAQGSLYAVVIPQSEGSIFDAEVVDQAGNQYLQLRGYRTVALPNGVDAEPLKALRAVAA